MRKFLNILEGLFFIIFYGLFILMITRLTNGNYNNSLVIELLAGFFVLFLFISPVVYMLNFFFKVSKIKFIKYVISAIPLTTISIYVLVYIVTNNPFYN